MICDGTLVDLRRNLANFGLDSDSAAPKEKHFVEALRKMVLHVQMWWRIEMLQFAVESLV